VIRIEKSLTITREPPNYFALSDQFQQK